MYKTKAFFKLTALEMVTEVDKKVLAGISKEAKELKVKNPNKGLTINDIMFMRATLGSVGINANDDVFLPKELKKAHKKLMLNYPKSEWAMRSDPYRLL